MNSSQTFVDVHVLQTVPPSNLNRDDAGSPKQAVYGGVRRSRVSSQSWKRATRKSFTDALPRDEHGTRTKRVSKLLTDELLHDTSLDRSAVLRISNELLSQLKVKGGKKESETAYLLFFGYRQIEHIADLVRGDLDELAALGDKELTERLKSLPVAQELLTAHPIDVALFGRMVADLPRLNVDAACQVAHALSTHSVETEFDYFTAVDDEKGKDEDLGAGMIGTIEFNSATLYRYATVALDQLARNLEGDVERTVQALGLFVEGFVKSIPTGHGNSFAHRTLPELVYVAVRDDQPVNLVSAFEEPVRSKNGNSAASGRLLAKESLRLIEQWVSPPVESLGVYKTQEDPESNGMLASAFGPAKTFPALLDRLREVATDRLQDAGS